MTTGKPTDKFRRVDRDRLKRTAGWRKRKGKWQPPKRSELDRLIIHGDPEAPKPTGLLIQGDPDGPSVRYWLEDG